MVHPLYPKLPPLQIRTNKMKIVHFNQCYCKTNMVEHLWFFMHFFSCNFENSWKTTSINFSSWSSSQFIKKSARKIERLIVKKIAFFSCIFQDKMWWSASSIQNFNFSTSERDWILSGKSMHPLYSKQPPLQISTKKIMKM